MSDAPEWIWAYTGDGSGDRMTDYGTWDIGGMDGIPDCHPHWPHVKYVRADLRPTDEQIMAHPKVKALVEALEQLDASCTCREAWSGRKLQDPDCPAGDYGDIARAGLGLAPRCQYNIRIADMMEKNDE